MSTIPPCRRCGSTDFMHTCLGSPTDRPIPFRPGPAPVACFPRRPFIGPLFIASCDGDHDGPCDWPMDDGHDDGFTVCHA